MTVEGFTNLYTVVASGRTRDARGNTLGLLHDLVLKSIEIGQVLQGQIGITEDTCRKPPAR